MILDDIVAAKKKRLVRHKENVSEQDMKNLALNEKRVPISFYNALRKQGLSIIGEFKKASPSHGKMNNKIELTDRIDQYNNAVDAISCLTEEDYFLGNTDYLKQIRKITNLPIIRKDFIIDEYQVYEAKVIGADAILLIAAILDDEKFKELYDLAYSLSLDVLCEVHNEEEMQRMINLGVKIIGINNRNLKTFEVSLDTTKKLASLAPEGTVLVSESGVLNDDDIKVLKASGADALLIGTAFMENENPNGDIIRSQTYNALFPLLMVAAIYLIMVLFFEKSKRNIAIDRAAEMIKKLDKNIQKTAVVVSPDINQIKAITDVGFDYIQIHKDMPDDILEKITIPVIRAVNMPDEINGAETESNFNDEIEKLIKNDKIYGILFDAGVPGSGKTFRWHRINGIKEKIKYSGKKFFLAGGLNPDNVKEAVLQVNPDVVDVSSGVEKDTGAGKDREKTEKFIKNIRKEQEKNYG